MIDKQPPLKWIDIDKLVLWPEANVRKSEIYTDYEDLKNNIKKNGIKNPLLVSGKTKEGKYRVFSGQRRLMASTDAGLKQVPCFIHEKITLSEAQLLSFSENLFRLKMNYNDIADAAKKFIEHFKDRKLVAKALGVSENTVKRYLRYEDVPKAIKELVGKRKLSAKQAMDLYSKFPDQDKSIRIAREISRINSRPQKKKLYYAVKYSDTKDSVESIRKSAAKMKPFKRYIIEVPPKENEVIQRISKKRAQKAEETIVDILETAINALENGVIEI